MGAEFSFQLPKGREKKKREQKDKATLEILTFLQGSSRTTGRTTHMLCNHSSKCMSEGILATSLKITVLRNRALLPLARLSIKISFKLAAEHRVKPSPREWQLPPFTSHHWQKKSFQLACPQKKCLLYLNAASKGCHAGRCLKAMKAQIFSLAHSVFPRSEPEGPEVHKKHRQPSTFSQRNKKNPTSLPKDKGTQGTGWGAQEP